MTSTTKKAKTPPKDKKAYLTREDITFRNSKGEPVEVKKHTIVWLHPDKAQTLRCAGKLTESWTDYLSESERQKLPKLTDAILRNKAIYREEAEVQAVMQIISQRPIAGKCDRCERSKDCMLTPPMRQLCEVVKGN